MNDDWKQRREGGGRFAIRLIRGIGRYGGRGVARACLLPITLYFLLRRSAERRDSLAYLARAFGRHATWWDAARHIHCFASTILDRVFLLGGELDRFEVATAGVEHLHAALDRGRGALLLGSHLGSFEVLRVLARERSDYVIRVVLDKGHNPAMTQLLDELNPQIAAGVIDAGQDGPSLMLQIQQAVQSGALVALLADRVHGGEHGVDADFLGDPARFPMAPMQVAAALKVPVVLGFGLYRGGNRYDLVFEAFSDGLDIPRPRRNAEIAALIRRYAERLEHHARSAPFNWFNFYDFWFHPDADSEAGVRTAPRGHGRDRVGVGDHA
jgi:predicted LPLAT superfamily acyltransferase